MPRSRPGSLDGLELPRARTGLDAATAPSKGRDEPTGVNYGWSFTSVMFAVLPAVAETDIMELVNAAWTMIYWHAIRVPHPLAAS